MERMFNECKALTSLDLSSFNTSKVKNMSYMFINCNSLKEITLGPGFSFIGTDHRFDSTWYDSEGNSYTYTTMSNKDLETYYAEIKVEETFDDNWIVDLEGEWEIVEDSTPDIWLTPDDVNTSGNQLELPNYVPDGAVLPDFTYNPNLHYPTITTPGITVPSTTTPGITIPSIKY
jgi:surface protein